MFQLKPGDSALMTLTDLQQKLKERGIVDVPRTTFRNWCYIGVKSKDGQTVYLHAVKIGQRKMSSIEWFKEFMVAQSTKDGTDIA